MKISVKLSDVERIVRNAYSMSASDERSDCSQSTKPWHQVPGDWYALYPPNELLSGNEMIQIRYRNGQLRQGIASSWTRNWCQDDSEWDIVEYRIA